MREIGTCGFCHKNVAKHRTKEKVTQVIFTMEEHYSLLVAQVKSSTGPKGLNTIPSAQEETKSACS